MEYNVKSMREDVGFTRTWEPMEFSGWEDENISWKVDCCIGDWSQMVEYRVKGPDALRLFSDFAVNSFDKYALNQAKHIIFCNHDGYIMGEGILIRLAEDEFEFQSGGPVWSWIDYNAKKGNYDLVSEKRDNKFKYQVAGPKSIFLLEKITGSTTLREIKFMHIGPATIKGVQVNMLRQGMSGEIGFEIQGPKERGKEIYDYICKEGKAFGIREIGAKTAMVNHMEACFPTVVHDYLPALTGDAEQDYWNTYKEKMSDFKRFYKVGGSFEGEKVSDWYRNPYELAWGNRVKFTHDFYGKEALEAIAASPKRKLVTLVWNKEDVMDVALSTFRDEEPYDYMELPRTQRYCCHADKVMAGNKVIGLATNRCFSFYFHETISHCSIDVEYAEIGTEVQVVWGKPGSRQKVIRATVARSPYKEDNRYTDLKKV